VIESHAIRGEDRLDQVAVEVLPAIDVIRHDATRRRNPEDLSYVSADPASG
jgi:hypothetical protein